MLLKNKYPLAISLITFVVSIIVLFSGKSNLSFYISVDAPTDLHVTIEKKDYLFKSKSTSSIRLEKANTYNFQSVDYENIENLTLSLNHDSKLNSKTRLYYALLKKPGYHPIHFNINEIELGKNTQLIGLSNILVTGGKNQSLTLKTNNALTSKIDSTGILINFIFSTILFLILSISNFNTFKSLVYTPRFLIIPFVLLIIFCVALTMAVQSRYNASPDEHDHFLAAEYYKKNSKTPKKGTDEAVFSYNSTWNYSRVYNKELDYLLTGKFSDLFKKMSIQSYKSIRFFNVSLILLLFVLSLVFPKYNIIFLPFVIAPQPWYIMSYINNGALPLFLSFLLLIITEKNKEFFHVDFNTNKKKYLLFLLGVILGAILLSKRNYLIYGFSYLVYIFFLCNDYSISFELSLKKYIQLYKPLLIIISIALVTFTVRIASIELLNDEPAVLSENVQDFYKKSQENRAQLFKTGRAGKDHYGSYFESTKKWISQSYNSFNGNYGYMQYSSSKKHYNKLLIIHILFIILLAYYSVKNYSKELLVCSLILIGVAGLLFFASSYLYSYMYDFQPQGKYLLPMLPVLGLFIYKCNINTKILAFSVIILFFFSMYSFVFTGILNLK